MKLTHILSDFSLTHILSEKVKEFDKSHSSSNVVVTCRHFRWGIWLPG